MIEEFGENHSDHQSIKTTKSMKNLLKLFTL